MTTHNENPPITPVLSGFTFVEVLVLIAAGGGLFFLTDWARTQWPWEIPPFNARFAGTIYLSSMVAVAMMLVGNRWAPARLVLPMLFTFTFIVLVMSLLRLNTFLFDRWATWGWFILYISLPLNALAHMWLYRRLPPADPTPAPAPWRNLLIGLGAVLGVYGALQFFLPEAVSAFWPWKIDAFHGQMYSAIFLTGAVGAFVLVRAAAPIEYFTLGITYAVFGFFALVGLVTVDAAVHRVNWAAPGTWLWLFGFVVILIAGLALMWQPRGVMPGERHPPGTTPAGQSRAGRAKA